MNMKKLLLLVILITPWLTTPFIGWKSFKRYLPASLVMSGVGFLEDYLADKFGWWKFNVKFHPKLIGGGPYNLGLYIVSTLWTLKFTYGKFPAFMILTMFSNAIFNFVFTNIISRLGLITFKNMSKMHFYIILCIKAVLLYFTQYFFENKK
ncbi:hypothetical protein [Halalkalibacter sp. APA_J-10(15)]|uniref:hypothetical protein n=1 Tax=Halalkalibacter sp. APA_J-10(15) TaxID=2933805 RepID=UPI001FF22CD9|nr:hypothetical protein [Halalkalibacter sp. APA_J-10(15)]MCK0472517.1 hypothetical protein [Halalkalibacter sp. APA_J-10(15)]